MNDVYRFRTIERILGKSQELEKQYIYFASQEQLNDPMEGFRDIVWHGDNIVWSNFFKQYLYCLVRTYIDLKIFGDDMTRLELEYRIPITERRDRFSQTELSDNTELLFDIFSDFYFRVSKKYELEEFIDEIVRTRRKTRHDEVLLYLQRIHFGALIEIQDAFVMRGLDIKKDQEPVKYYNKFKRLSDKKFFDSLREMEKKVRTDALFQVTNEILSDLIFIHKSKFSDNQQLVLFDYPRVYLKYLIDRLLYPKWYGASFMKDYQNSSVWGHYADGHRGVCLIFETKVSGEKDCLPLKKRTHSRKNGKTLIPIALTFHEINYKDKVGEIDFFRSIGTLSRPQLIDQWYSDNENHHMSECSAHLGPKSDENNWRKNYWEKFYRDITIKTKDWEYEREIRLILNNGMLENFDDKEQRKLIYEFHSLKGLIFGINTSDKDKLKIMETIKGKRSQNNHNNFKFYQAYYNPEDGNIHKYELTTLSKLVSSDLQS